MHQNPVKSERCLRRLKSLRQMQVARKTAREPFVPDYDESQTRNYHGLLRPDYQFNRTMDLPEPEEIIVQSGCNEVSTEI